MAGERQQRESSRISGSFARARATRAKSVRAVRKKSEDLSLRDSGGAAERTAHGSKAAKLSQLSWASLCLKLWTCMSRAQRFCATTVPEAGNDFSSKWQVGTYMQVSLASEEEGTDSVENPLQLPDFLTVARCLQTASLHLAGAVMPRSTNPNSAPKGHPPRSEAGHHEGSFVAA